ncbi:hypothetical protein SAMN03080614_101629 [Anaerobranca gottschalkii DSM 13577]|uniref:Uncharacterized protein n=1 Tax=Anaerobranca gottschalkii DSM 13577 TaxID=1120990 RepID=A0A1I0A2B7_9FIRM|nr:hypothetical protein SAMN03080614_101629 [Anaerobranca gottschalkii DSM 13577]
MDCILVKSIEKECIFFGNKFYIRGNFKIRMYSGIDLVEVDKYMVGVREAIRYVKKVYQRQLFKVYYEISLK